MSSSSSARFGFSIAISRILRIGDLSSLSMSVIGGLYRMSLTSWIRFFRAVLFAWSSGMRFTRDAASLFRLIFRSLEKESRNSSHSSIMSRSVFGFLPSKVSIWYFIELKIRTSAFA